MRSASIQNFKTIAKSNFKEGILSLPYLVFVTLCWDVKIGKSQSVWLCNKLNSAY